MESVSVGFREGRPVLDRINMKLERGSFHFLMGPSGVGKTTLLKLLYLGLRDFSGDIQLFGRDLKALNIRDLPLLRQHIGVVFQEFKLLDHMTAIENVALPLKVLGVNHKSAYAQAQEILAWVGLEDSFHTRPQFLSGGQKQRIAIARAVVNRPSLFLADEPTGNVDDAIGYKIFHLFEELHKQGTTVLVATHNKELAKHFKHPVLTLKGGRLV